MSDRKFSLYEVEQFIREAGAERVTEDAVLNLERELEKLAEKIANKAIRYAEHAGRRKLIRKSDILLTDHSVVSTVYRKRKILSANASMTNAASIIER